VFSPALMTPTQHRPGASGVRQSPKGQVDNMKLNRRKPPARQNLGAAVNGAYGAQAV
jgi:hypothetical protein